MIKNSCKQISTWGSLVLLLIMSMSVYAALTSWQIVPNESKLTFTGTQNNAPFSGEFKKFTGEISFDPNDLNNSKAHIIIDIDSISTSYKEIADTLKTADWFASKEFPTAVFTADHFTKNADNTYKADGKLTIRNKTIPITLNFVSKTLANNKMQLTGSTMLKRTAFGIGQGEWGGLKEVKDDVQVNFDIVLTR